MTRKHLYHRIDYRHTGGDSRLLYGMGGPLLVAIALICAVLITGELWLVPILMLAMLVLTGMVLMGLSYMLDEDGDSDD